MNDSEQLSPGFLHLVRRLTRTGFGMFANRIELVITEFEQEKSRLVETFFWALLSVFLAGIAMIVLTATIIFLFPEDLRVYAAIGFGFLYLIGAIAALSAAKKMLTRSAFSETINQVKKDSECLASSK